MKTILLLAVLCVLAAHSHAATTIVDYTVNTGIPDNSSTGFADTRTITGSSIQGITEVEVRLKFSGGWNGDLYVYLSHSSGFSVLLNRPGKTTLDTIGSGSSGMDISLNDAATFDVHTGMVSSGVVTGLYQPDGRAVDPDLVIDLSPRTALLSSFNGLSANGDWTLFVADMSAGDESMLTDWGLTIIGTVPEPSRALLMMMGLSGMLLRRRRTAACVPAPLAASPVRQEVPAKTFSPFLPRGFPNGTARW